MSDRDLRRPLCQISYASYVRRGTATPNDTSNERMIATTYILLYPHFYTCFGRLFCTYQVKNTVERTENLNLINLIQPGQWGTRRAKRDEKKGRITEGFDYYFKFCLL